VLLVILPFASNFLIRIYAWIIVLGPADLLYSPFAVIAGMVYVHLPFMILPLYTNLEKHDPALLEAAQDLGAGTWTRFSANHAAAVAAGHLGRLGAGLHPGARHVRDSRTAWRHGRHPGRQSDQGAVPRKPRLAARGDAVDPPDHRRAAARRHFGVGRATAPGFAMKGRASGCGYGRRR
jgi:hypothetical protein